MDTLHQKTRAELEAVSPYVFDTTKDAMLVKCLDTFKVWCLKEDVSVTPSLYQHGYWESWITSWFTRNIQEGDFVLDIGANCGYYTMLFEKLVGPVGQVVAYECNPAYVGLLNMTKVVNNANFKIEATALGDRHGVIDLAYPGMYTGSASVVSNFDPSWGEVTSVKVPITTLDRDFDGMRPPDIVKIDAEGAEEMIWNGGSRLWYDPDLPPVIVLEYTPGAYTEKFTQELFEYGDVTQIGFDGNESEITPEILRQASDWVMIVVRRTVF